MKDWLAMNESAWRTEALLALQRFGEAALLGMVAEIDVPYERRDHARYRAWHRRWDLVLSLERLVLGG